jgi:hypothetical protein
MHPSDYEPCQQLEEAARAEDIQLICYASVRDPEHKPNAAIMTCNAFAAPAPTQNQTWRLWFNKAGVHAICEFLGEKFSVAPEQWASDERLQSIIWSEAGSS